MVDKTFLENNLFEQSKYGAGSFPWFYEDKNILVVITLNADCGDYPTIYIENKQTKRSIQYAHTHHDTPRLMKGELKKCLQFLDCIDDFEY